MGLGAPYPSQAIPASPEPLQHVAYLCDGTVEGYLSCIFQAYVRKEVPEDIVEERSYQPRLGQSALVVQTDQEQAWRVRKGIVRESNARVFMAVVRALCSCDCQAGIAVYRFVRYLMDPHSGRNKRLGALSDLANPVVASVVALQKRVINEEEKMRQFVRFSHLENGVWFARCNPSANVVPLVMPHFVERFNVQPFIIYDEAHQIAGIYDGAGWSLAAGAVHVPAQRASEDAYVQLLWQRFYDAVSIESRYNPELRRHFMPMRLWRNLPELAAQAPGPAIESSASSFPRPRP